LALALTVISTGLAQGYVLWGNASGSKISINGVAGGVLTGVMPANATAPFYFALFYSTSTTVGGISTAIMPSGNVNGTYVFQDSNWTFLNPGPIAGYVTGPAYGTNAAGLGRYTVVTTDPGHGAATITANMAAERWVVLGWSGNVATDLAGLATWYNGGNPQTAGWIGESLVSSLIAPGDPTDTAGSPPSVFPGVFSLGVTYLTVPEPSTIALAGLGGISLLLFRRRK
jgi:hypothetical protein